jgi:hypothetical protein
MLFLRFGEKSALNPVKSHLKKIDAKGIDIADIF